MVEEVIVFTKGTVNREGFMLEGRVKVYTIWVQVNPGVEGDSIIKML